MTTRLPKTLAVLFAFIFFSQCSQPITSNGEIRLPDKPNILMITCEDISPFLGSYGDSVAKTPHLDELARNGVRYTNMYSVSGVCAPSRSALATGMYPTSIGTHNMRTLTNLSPGLPDYAVVVPEGVKHYAELMRAEGYYVTNNQKSDYQFRGPITAWDEVSSTASYDKRAEGQPFFAIHNATVCHESRIWKKANDPLLADPDKVPVPPYFPDDSIIRKDIARAYSNITEMDKWVGRLIDSLKSDGLYDKTVIIFYSDHGGPFPRHKRELYDTGLKVPFIVRYPYNQLAGTVDEALHSFVDIPVSVLSLAGVSIPDIMQGEAFLGNQASKTPRKYIYASRDRMDSEYDRVRAVRDSRFKYLKNYYPEKPYIQDIDYRLNMDLMVRLIEMHNEGQLNEVQKLWFRETKDEEELFDTENDPYELNNLAGDPQYASKLNEMRDALQSWQDKVGDLGEIPEEKLIEQMWNGQENAPVTKPVNYILSEDKSQLTLKCPTDGASIGYQVDNEIGNGRWRVYTHPFAIEGFQEIRLRAHRIGYEPSEVLDLDIEKL